MGLKETPEFDDEEVCPNTFVHIVYVDPNPKPPIISLYWSESEIWILLDAQQDFCFS